MSYSLTRNDLASITDVEMAFSTERLLPQQEDIPKSFWGRNPYSELASAIFYGTTLPDGEMTFHPTFTDDAAAADLSKCVRAHLKSFAPKHEHKIAGVGFMIAQVCEITANIKEA